MDVWRHNSGHWKGKTKEALVKYNEVLKYAPNWPALKAARDAAAKVTR